VTVYIYKAASNTYDSLALVDTADYDWMQKFTGASLAAIWTPIAARIERAEKRGDFPSLASHLPVLSKRAFEILHPLIASEVEPLILKVPEGDLIALNVLDVCDCLDVEHSEIKRHRSGSVMYIRNHVFDEKCIEGKHMFKVRESPLQKVYLSAEFKRCVQDAKLEGLIFREAGTPTW
jgi:hypothetical protein